MGAFRYLFLLLAIIGLASFSYYVEQLVFSHRNPFPLGTLEYKIERDLIDLEEGKQFPIETSRVEKIYLNNQSIRGKSLPWEKILAFFPQRQNGAYFLQALVFDSIKDKSSTSEEKILILQLSLFDSKTKNKIWELSRSYQIE